MERPRVADGGDGFRIWRVAAITLNMQSLTADKGYSSNFGVGRGGYNSSQIQLVTKCHTGPRIWAEVLPRTFCFIIIRRQSPC